MKPEMSGYELRKAILLALGWTECTDDHEGRLTGKCGTLLSPKGSSLDAPPLESSPSAFWPAFEAWMLEKRLHADMEMCFSMPDQESTHVVTIKRCLLLTEEWRGFGRSFTEAGCRAWLKALTPPEAQ